MSMLLSSYSRGISLICRFYPRICSIASQLARHFVVLCFNDTRGNFLPPYADASWSQTLLVSVSTALIALDCWSCLRLFRPLSLLSTCPVMRNVLGNGRLMAMFFYRPSLESLHSCTMREPSTASFDGHHHFSLGISRS